MGLVSEIPTREPDKDRVVWGRVRLLSPIFPRPLVTQVIRQVVFSVKTTTKFGHPNSDGTRRLSVTRGVPHLDKN